MAAEERARIGIFLGFQYPVEIPGVSITNFMRTALNEIREYRNQPPLSASEFLARMEEKKELVEIHSKLTNRSVNEGFSGGEKKRNEIFQMAMLEPTFSVLDETDSGLDIDALKSRHPEDRDYVDRKWEDAMFVERGQLFDYDTFIDLGKGAKTPEGYLRIKVHMVFAVKHDGRYKARCVAGGHLAPPSVESVYSGVVSMRQFRIVAF